MISSQTIRLVPEELLRKTMVICRADASPTKFKDPIKRGTVLWLREQAKLAENDPDREWLGLRHEFDLLLSGNHPDPHPELIIYGHPVDNFDPHDLDYPSGVISMTDNSALTMRVARNWQTGWVFPSRANNS